MISQDVQDVQDFKIIRDMISQDVQEVQDVQDYHRTCLQYAFSNNFSTISIAT